MQRTGFASRVSLVAGGIFALVGIMSAGIARGVCPTPAAVSQGPRYIAIAPSLGETTPVAILITTGTPFGPCGKYVDFDTDATLAALGVGRLVAEPVFRTPTEWGTLFVRGSTIVPDATCSVYADCGDAETPDLSSAATVVTYGWGDVVGTFSGGQWTLPNGVVDFEDISAIVDAFRHLLVAPAVYQVDLWPEQPDYSIDFFDIGFAVDAFRGQSYPKDCNENGVRDVCDIALGTSDDCNMNSIPDECETDCNFNGTPDDCDVSGGSSEDCNENGIPDECDPDCDTDGVPDDCDTFDDCDGDYVHDCFDQCICTNPPDRPCFCPEFDRCCFVFMCLDDYPREFCLLQGGTPDCLLPYPCLEGCLIGDFDQDGDIDADDAVVFQACYGGPDVPHGGGGCEFADFDYDGDVDCDDWVEFELAWTEPSDPPSFPTCP